MAGLSTNAPGLWGGFAGLLYGSTSLSTPPGFLADATPAWVLPGAALDLDFADSLGYNSRNLATTTPDSILTYTAPSPKMVYGSDGVLRYAPHNLLLQSEAFATSPWADTIQGTGVAPAMTADAGNDPNGNPTADRIQFSLAGGTATTDISRRRQSITVIATPHTFSVYLRSYDGSSTYNMHLTDPSGLTRNIVVTGSWQRFEVSATAPATPVTYSVGLRGGQIPANSNTADVLAWGAQLNAGSSALTYIPTTTAAVYSLPIDHNPTTFDPLGVLIEEQRTNLLTYSADYSNTAWSKSNITVTLNNTTGPDGVALSAAKIAATASTFATFYQGAVVAAAAATATVYVKKGSGATDANKFNLYNLTTTNTLISGTLNYDTGVWTYTTGSSGVVVTALPNGWYALSITSAMTSGNTIRIYPCFDGNTETAGEFAYLWGAQLEAGSFPTSYVPTVASQVTRLADQVSILTSAFGWSATAGTVATEYYDSGINSALWRVDDGGDNYYFRAIRDTGSMVASAVYGGVAYPVYLTATAKGMPTKFAAGWDAASINAAINGTLGTANTSLILPTVLIFRIGNNRNAQFYNSHIKRLTYFPTRRTDADLQVLTRGDDLVWGAGDYLVWGSGNNLTW